MHGSSAELAGALALLAALVYLASRYLRKRPDPDEAERRRREAINSKGKLGDGEIVDFDGAAIVYEYQVAGVGYTTSQDVSNLAFLLPAARMSMVGPASVKYDPRNPANSIVLCEQWSGLRDCESNFRRGSDSQTPQRDPMAEK
jgi:hypothetical protein